MNQITSTAGAALDRLHPDQPGRSPRAGTDADRLTCAAMALVAVLRVAPDGIAIVQALAEGHDGALTITCLDVDQARQLATRLGLGGPRVTEVDDGWVRTGWRGTWADWPIVVQHVGVDPEFRAPAAAARGADVLAVVQP